MNRTFVFCRLRFVAFHFWEKAPAKVDYLRKPHRHEFHVEAYKQVQGLDREIEFIQLKEQLTAYLRAQYEGKTFSLSCEYIANDLVTMFNLAECSVSEDGENGAVVFNPEKQ